MPELEQLSVQPFLTLCVGMDAYVELRISSGENIGT